MTRRNNLAWKMCPSEALCVQQSQRSNVVKKLAQITALSVAALTMGGCAATLTQAERVAKVTPQWYQSAADIEKERGASFLAGKGAGVSQSQDVALQMAKMRAQTAIGQQVSLTVRALAKTAAEQTGGADGTTVEYFSSAAQGMVNDVNLSGTRVRQQHSTAIGDTFYVWVLMEYAVGEMNAKLLDSLKKDKAKYDKFVGKQLLDDMNKEIEKYNEFKKTDKPAP